jgi:hypothetical protein
MVSSLASPLILTAVLKGPLIPVLSGVLRDPRTEVFSGAKVLAGEPCVIVGSTSAPQADNKKPPATNRIIRNGMNLILTKDYASN